MNQPQLEAVPKPRIDPLVEGRELHKRYDLAERSLEVLRGVSIAAGRGDFLAMRGASGAGKSTLLHLLGGLDTPTAGEVWLGGRNLATLCAKRLWFRPRAGTASQPESRVHFPGLPFAPGIGRARKCLPARALINSPDLILADEPTGNLDSHTGDEIIDLLCSLRAERQTTLIIATHDAHVAARAPRVIELADSSVIPVGCRMRGSIAVHLRRS